MCLNIWHHSFQELHDSLFLIDSIQNEIEIILVNVLEIFSYKNKPHSRIVCPKFDFVICKCIFYFKSKSEYEIEKSSIYIMYECMVTYCNDS